MPFAVRALATLASLLFVFVDFTSARAEQATAGAWRRVSSNNFVVISNAGDARARESAARLEELRAIFSRLPAAEGFDLSAPVTVILFQTASDYEFFKPTYGSESGRDVAGYFQFSPDINYIALSLDVGRGRSFISVLFHEYVHALVRQTYAGAPVWFNEGLAQYYSEFELSRDRRRVSLGRPLTYRLESLGRGAQLPLDTLLSADDASPHYQHADKQSLFYAQSWAFVHYLLSDATGARQAQLARYLELTRAGTPVAESFRQAFKVDFASMERALASYIRAARYEGRDESFAEPVASDAKLESRALSQAEAGAALGDLLLHTSRPEDAEEYLMRALKLDAQVAAAHSSLGLLRLRQNRMAEAREHLERAVALEPANYLARFYYADLLRREGLETEKTVAGYAATTRLIRAELKRVIELAPRFLEAYSLLGQVDLERSPQVDETFAILRRASALAPKRQEFNLLIAQLHLRREEFGSARQILEPLAHERRPAYARAEARALLERVAVGEEEAAARRRMQSALAGETAAAGSEPGSEAKATASPEAAAVDAQPIPLTQPCDMPQPGPQFKPLRFDGRQACGQLVSVECEEAGGVTLLVETGQGTLKLRSAALNRIRFVSYTRDVHGRVECGLRTRSNPVLVTYRLTINSRTSADGEALAVEFVPPDWVH